MAIGYRDANGNAWTIEQAGAFKARITAATYGLPAGRLLVVMPTLEQAKEQIEEIADQWNVDGKEPIPRAGTAVEETPAGSAGVLIVILAVVLVLGQKSRR